MKTLCKHMYIRIWAFRIQTSDIIASLHKFWDLCIKRVSKIKPVELQPVGDSKLVVTHEFNVILFM